MCFKGPSPLSSPNYPPPSPSPPFLPSFPLLSPPLLSYPLPLELGHVFAAMGSGGALKLLHLVSHVIEYFLKSLKVTRHHLLSHP